MEAAGAAEIAEPEPLETPSASARGAPFPASSPSDGEPLDAITATSADAVGAMVERAREAQRTWAETPVADRISAVRKARKRLLERAEEVAELLRRECGKPVEEAALSEVLPNADLFDYWATSAEELLEPAPLDLDPLAYPGKTGHVHRAPRGVIGLITPWNYPVAIPLRTLVPALIAGNAVIFKPSEVTPRAGALVASLFDGLLPEGVLQVAQGGGDLGASLVGSKIDLVVFTGSVATGKKIAVACAERLLPCSLELGGKDAAIVLADCDIERTARGIVWGAFTNAGQNCASIERVYVVKAAADKLIPRIVELTKELRPAVDTGVLTTEAQCELVRRHVAEALASGAELLAGGEPDEGSLAFPPTVIRVEDEATPLMTDETFGPILPIFVVADEEEALERTNASRFALTTSLWTRRFSHAQKLARRLRSGVVTVNNHGFTAALPMAPWTGVGESGHGVTNGPHALGELTRPRLVLEDRNRAKRELWWYPYTPVLRTVAFAMARARGGAGFFGRIAAVLKLVTAVPRRLFGG